VPLILVLTGLVALRVARCDAERAWAAPLAGAAIWSLAGTYALMSRTPPWGWCVGLLALVLGLAIHYRREVTLRTPECAAYAVIYLFTLGVMCVIPFPGMWLMGGDWIQHYGMASAIWERTFGVTHLARSPSFAAGAIVCLPFHPGLASYQIYVAATTAASLLVFLAGARTPGVLARRRWAMGCLAVSAFYLVHLQNLWPNWLAAGFFVTAILEALRYRRDAAGGTALLAIFWFGVGIAVHESTAFAFPLLLAAFGRPALVALLRQPRIWAATLAIMGLTFAGWQAWTLHTYGYRARAGQSPLTTWHEERTLPVKLGVNAVDQTVGLLLPDVRARVSALRHATSRTQMAEISGYLAIALNTWMAATLLTIFGPMLWVLRAEIGTLWSEARRAGEVTVWAAAAAVTFAINCAVLPTAPRYGGAQAGLTQVCLLAFVPLVLRLLDRAPSVRLRWIVRWHLLTGFAPFAALALGVLLALHLPHAGRAALVERLAVVDADWNAVRQLGLELLSAKFFPGGLIVFLLGCVVLWSGALAAAGQNVRTRHRRGDGDAEL